MGVHEAKLDIVYVLDMSGSITEKEVEQLKTFLVKSTDKLNVGKTHTQVALISFGTECYDNGDSAEKLASGWNPKKKWGWCPKNPDHPKERFLRYVTVEQNPFAKITDNSKCKKAIKELRKIGGRTPTYSALEEVKNMFKYGVRGSRYDDPSVKKIVITFTDGFSSFNNPDDTPYFPDECKPCQAFYLAP